MIPAVGCGALSTVARNQRAQRIINGLPYPQALPPAEVFVNGWPLDMGISLRTVAWLRSQGHDAVHLSEQNLQRLADEDVLAKARPEGRILLTMDLDFGYLLAVSGEQVPSVILFRLSDESSQVVNERLPEVLAQCESDLEEGAVISVSEEAIRVRRLPI